MSFFGAGSRFDKKLKGKKKREGVGGKPTAWRGLEAEDRPVRGTPKLK